jgi:hypothetical protein
MVRAELNQDGKPKQVIGPADGAAPASAIASRVTPVERAALMRFLAREIEAGFDPQAATTEQFATAYHLIAEAAELLQNVADKLRDARTVGARRKRRTALGEECPACGLHVGAGNACDVVLCPICHATLEWNGEWVDVSPQPDEDDDADVVALTLNYATAFQMIERVARPQSGQLALVAGANGGVGAALFTGSPQYRRDPRSFHEDLPRLFDLLARGLIKPRIAARLPLLAARRGNEMLEAGGLEGKIVLLASLR